MEQLRNDMDMLLVGGNGVNNVVIVVKWIKLQGGSQRLEIPRYDLFGAALLASRSEDDLLYPDIQRLRGHATRALRFMDLIPVYILLFDITRFLGYNV